MSNDRWTMWRGTDERLKRAVFAKRSEFRLPEVIPVFRFDLVFLVGTSVTDEQNKHRHLIQEGGEKSLMLSKELDLP